MKRKIIAVAAFAALFGCTQQAGSQAQASKNEPQSSPPTIIAGPTPDEWREALQSTFKMSSEKDAGDGIAEFTACFYKAAAKCGAFSFGSRDSFRKLRFFVPGVGSNLANSLCPAVKSYISLRDNKAPLIFLTPCYFSKNGWIFMNRLAIMADGEVVLEREFKNQKVEREPYGAGVVENYSFVATAQDIEGLRKISSKSKVLIRITGDRGYAGVEKQWVKMFVEEVDILLYIYDSLNAALLSKLPPE